MVDKIIKQKQLCEEAATLIGEFSKEAGLISETQIKNIKTKASEGTVIITNKDGEDIQYTISEISYLFQDKISDFWPLGNKFFTNLEFTKTIASTYFSDLDKMDFIEYIGNLHYAELRCNEIIQRIKELEYETLSL